MSFWNTLVDEVGGVLTDVTKTAVSTGRQVGEELIRSEAQDILNRNSGPAVETVGADSQAAILALLQARQNQAQPPPRDNTAGASPVAETMPERENPATASGAVPKWVWYAAGGLAALVVLGGAVFVSRRR